MDLSGLRFADSVRTGWVNVNESSNYWETHLPFGGRAGTASGNGQSAYYAYELALSADGRFVAFDSDATDLVTKGASNLSHVYVRNIQADPRVRVKSGRRWRAGTAHILPDEDPYALLKKLNRPLNDSVLLAVGTRQLVIRVDLDR